MVRRSAKGIYSIAKAIDPPLATRDELGLQHIAIERVGRCPVRDMNDRVVEADGTSQHHTLRRLSAGRRALSSRSKVMGAKHFESSTWPLCRRPN